MAEAYVLLLIGSLLGTLRWQILLRSQGIGLKYWATLKLCMIGNFFGVFGPGSVSGDVAKGYYLGREFGVSRSLAPAAGSMFFDRLTGFMGLLLVSAIGVAGLLWKDGQAAPLLVSSQVRF